jgi:hypothetical protein
MQMLKDKVKIVDGCWIWIKSKDEDGYGNAWHEGKKIAAHRLSFKLNVGDIPKGMFVCHTCDTPSCINPEHLFLGTPKDNTKDMINKGRAKNQNKTHCPRGHEYNEINTRIDTKGWRKCRVCHRTWEKAAKRVRRAPRGQSGQCGGE